MSKIRVLIVEDDLIVAQEMSAQLTDVGFDVLEVVSSAYDARRALHVYQLDIILIDIKLRGEENGISLGIHIYNDFHLPIIFVTSLSNEDTVKAAIAARPAAYLVKPYNPRALQVAIEVAFSNFEKKLLPTYGRTQAPNQSHYTLDDRVFVKDSRNRLERVNCNDILWLKAESSYVEINTQERKYLLTTDTLGSFIEKLRIEGLLRVHRSYAINLKKVTAVEGNTIEIGDQVIPIGKNYRTLLKGYFQGL